jgi:hypothetical protein
MQRTLFTVSALLSAIAVNASPYKVTSLRRAVADVPGYDYMGCYTEATDTRALSGKTYYDDLMTPEKCATACSGFLYFGVEYGQEVCRQTFEVDCFLTRIVLLR